MSRMSGSDAMTAVLVVCAVLMTALVARRELAPRAAAEADYVAVPDWEAYAEGPRLGPADAEVTITVFSDFQCPYCKLLAEAITELRTELDDEVALVYRHHPLPHHPFARAAAVASECAHEQQHFWEYHDALFAGQAEIGVRTWTEFADLAALPEPASFATCVDRAVTPERLVADSVAARRIGVTGTPTFLINDRLYRGALMPGPLEAAIRDRLGG